MKYILTSLIGLFLLAGCASSRCKGEQDYQKAYSLPEVEVAGFKRPNSAGALLIPPAPAEIVPYGQLVIDPKTRKTQLECLDTPPLKS